MLHFSSFPFAIDADLFPLCHLCECLALVIELGQSSTITERNFAWFYFKADLTIATPRAEPLRHLDWTLGISCQLYLTNTTQSPGLNQDFLSRFWYPVSSI